MDDGVDTRTRLPAGVSIGDVEANDIVIRTGGIGKGVGLEVGQAEAVVFAVRLPECGADAASGAGEQHEAAFGLTHAGAGQKRVVAVESRRVTDPGFGRRSCSTPYCRSIRECAAPARPGAGVVPSLDMTHFA